MSWSFNRSVPICSFVILHPFSLSIALLTNMCSVIILAVIKCCSVTKLCPALCGPRDCGAPGSSVLRYLLECAQIHMHGVGDALSPSHPLLSPPFAFNLSQHESFPLCWIFASGGQSIGPSASGSILPINIQCWFPLGLTGLISLQPKGLLTVLYAKTPRIQASSNLIKEFPLVDTMRINMQQW